MNLPYLARLLCLCLASFFLLELALGLFARLIAPWVIRSAFRMEARLAARLLLALRLLPGGLGVVLVMGICMPSYLWLEPDAAAEQVGWGCLAAAALGLAVLGECIVRGIGALRRSRQYVRWCESGGCTMRSSWKRPSWKRPPVSVVSGEAGLVALTGVFRPRLLISQHVMQSLSLKQLAAVLGHERAHGMSRDNLKRLVILLSPGLFPFFRGFGALEQAWAVATEWAADDCAAAGSRQRALTLASALVQVARLKAHRPTPLLVTSLLADGAGLSLRIDRLLHPAPRHQGRPAGRILKTTAALTLVAGLAGMMAWPATLHSVHELLEDLIR